ncbi:MAG: HD domain-containing phosphohydrolase [Trueperaceae bacterium]
MRRLATARIALTYLLVAIVWILVSDRVAFALFGDAALLSKAQTGKGLAFVLGSALLIHLLVRRERQRWQVAERTAAREARRFEAVFRAGPAGVLIVDLEHRRYEDANDRFLAMLGRRRADLIGRSVDAVELWADPAERSRQVRELREHGRLLDRTALLRHADGTFRTVLWSADLMRLEGRTRMLVATVDLTERTEAYEQTLMGWARALDLRDHETAGHAMRVTDLTVTLGRRLGLPAHDLQTLKWGALLHDIGKIGIRDEILNKPGPLTDEEWAEMKRHPEIGRSMLEPITFLEGALEIPIWHHERWDGGGYPHGLAGEAIPPAARIFAVADVWDALTNDRPYRTAWSRERTVAHLRDGAGTHFDPEVVRAFLEMVSSGEVDRIASQASAA